MDVKPAISCPVMRFIGVADAVRSVAFYRDVLGFDVREQAGAIEAIYGPARIRFGTQDYAPNDWEEPRPCGSAMLFFETDHVTAMHAAIRARGGNPGEMEKVNWIKCTCSRSAIPTSTRSGFGQSYDQPRSPLLQPMMRKALPEVPYDSVIGGGAADRSTAG